MRMDVWMDGWMDGCQDVRLLTKVCGRPRTNAHTDACTHTHTHARSHARTHAQVLGSNIPAGASFYIIYIQTEIGVALMLQLYRWTWLSGSWLHLACCCTIPLRRSVYSPKLCSSYGVPTTPSTLAPASSLASVLFIFVLANSYAVIQPLLTVVAVLYAGVALAVNTFQMLAVSVRRYDSGGLMWRNVFGLLAACVVIPQFVLLAVIVTAHQQWLVGVQVVVLALTVSAFLALWFGYLRKAWRVTLEMARGVDAASASATTTGVAPPSMVALCRKDQERASEENNPATRTSGTSSCCPLYGVAVPRYTYIDNSNGAVAIHQHQQRLRRRSSASSHATTTAATVTSGADDLDDIEELSDIATPLCPPSSSCLLYTSPSPRDRG